MKKNIITLGIIVLLFAFVATGCASLTTENTECQATVVECVKGNFIKNPAYTALATKAMMSKDFSKVALYNNLAQSTGWYEYKVTINVEGEMIVLDTREEYEVGETITVIRVDTYVNGELRETTYCK